MAVIDNGSQILLDKPASIDALWISIFVNTLASFMFRVFENGDTENENRNPFFSIWITWKWGVGKSTVLRLMESRFLEIEAISLITRKQKYSERILPKVDNCIWDISIGPLLKGVASVIFFFKNVRPRRARFITINPWEYKKGDDFLEIFIWEIENSLKKQLEEKKAWKWIQVVLLFLVTFWFCYFLALILIHPEVRLFWTHIGLLIKDWHAQASILLSAIVAWIGNEMFADLKSIYKKATALKEQVLERKENRSQDSEPSRLMKKNVREEISALMKSYTEKNKLIFCIDDLDRCDHESIIGVLSTIKQFLWKSNCIIIVAYDEDIVERAIKEHSPNSIDSHEYLDKIFNLTIPLWQPGRKQIEMLALNIFEDDADIERGILSNTDYETTKDSVKDFLKKRVAEIPANNPRSLIKIANLFLFFSELYRWLEKYWSVLDVDYPSLLRIVSVRVLLPEKKISEIFQDEQQYNLMLRYFDKPPMLGENKDIGNMELKTTQEERKILNYAFWERRPRFLDSFQNFWSLYNPARVHSDTVFGFYKIINSDEIDWKELSLFLKKEENQQKFIENQLCYFKWLTAFFKRNWVGSLEKIKKSDPRTYLFIMWMYINFTETYSIANREKFRPSLEFAIDFINSELSFFNFKQFKSPLPIAKFISCLDEINKIKNEARYEGIILKHISSLRKLRLGKFEEAVAYLGSKSFISDFVVINIKRSCSKHWKQTQITRRHFSNESLFAAEEGKNPLKSLHHDWWDVNFFST